MNNFKKENIMNNSLYLNISWCYFFNSTSLFFFKSIKDIV